MIGIKSIIFEKNNNRLIIDINNESKITYKDICKIVDNKLIYKYLEGLFSIIGSWQQEYIDISLIDGDHWKLDINYIDGNTKEYSGRSSYPTNFEAFERLNQRLIDEVYNG